MGKKFVYQFSEGNDKMRELLGGKGANLAGMIKLGLPVPQGFTVTTEACNDYYKNKKSLGNYIVRQVLDAVKKLERKTGKTFGSAKNPLLLSVRSGARVSMPGMMDTILNIGLNDEVTAYMAKVTNNEKFAYDSYRRLIMMFGDVVKGVERDKFERILTKVKEKRNVKNDYDLSGEDFKFIAEQSKKVYEKELKTPFPQDAKEQLLEAVTAVFRSWETPRAVVYRRMNDIPSSWGTAVNVQEMVFGNLSETSGSGVAFTRNPVTGENVLYGEFLVNAQGEDVVAGVRTPKPIDELKQVNPKAFEEFVNICHILEKHYKDVQEVEFTIENGKLFMLQTRNGKRTAQAALKIAIDFVNEGIISKKEALLKIDPKILDTLLHPTFATEQLAKVKPLAQGLPASPGAASGVIALTSAKAKKLGEKGINVILVRDETNPEDIEGMLASKGVLTATGGMTSHAAVVARGMGTPCVAGCTALTIRETGEIVIGKKTYQEGDKISIDGSTGYIYDGVLKTQETTMSQDFATVMKWADEVAVSKVMANADNARDATKALELGAKGIGLTRTEHMFFEKDRIKAVREMIIATNAKEREMALAKILPMQKNDFIEIFKVMKDLPVTIRFLDMPLHEFLPREEREMKELAQDLKKPFEEIVDLVNSLSEFNPMMGMRGSRLSVVMQEIPVMQTIAVLEAAIEVKKKYNINAKPEIMVPLIGELNEYLFIKDIIVKTAEKLFKKHKIAVDYKIGTMIEVPRATLIADQLAKHADFFSFGTNDLTQMTYGFSRDDMGKFINYYFDNKILEFDPFAKLDPVGVGALIKNTVKISKPANKNIKFGICGEHAGDPSSVEFAINAGLNYVSCSPYRVPIARLASAQAAIKMSMKK